MRLTVIVIGDDELDVAASRGSFIDEPAFAGCDVLVRSVSDPQPWSRAAGDRVFFLRAGDRFLPGACEALSTALEDCEIAIGGHRLAGRGGWDVEVAPPSLHRASDLGDVAAEMPFELSAIAVRRSVLDSGVVPAPATPGGEIALLGAVLERGRCRSIRETVVRVRIRGEHQNEPEAVIERLMGVLHGPCGADAAVASRVRRRALSVAYLESPPSVAARFRPDSWWPPSARIVGPEQYSAVIRDLHWVAARATESRHIAEVGLDGVAERAPRDAVSTLPPDVSNLLITTESLHRMIAELSATVRWLHVEVRVRDEAAGAARGREAALNGALARLEATVSERARELALAEARVREAELAEAHALAEAQEAARVREEALETLRIRDEALARAEARATTFAHTSSRSMVRELWRRTRWHVRRITRGGSA